MIEEKYKKIAHVTPTFPPYAGGIGNVAYYVAKGLAESGYQITVFTPDYGNKDDSGLANEKFKLVKIKPLIKYGNAALLPLLIKKLSNFDIIHLHYPFFGAAESIYLLKKLKKGTKLVIHYHMDVVGEKLKKYLFKFHTKYFLSRIIKAADLVIVSSFDYALNSNLKPYLQIYGSKFIDIPHGVDTRYFKPDAKNQALVEKYDIQNKKMVLFVGSLDSAHYFKGVNYLIKAAEILKRDDYKIIIVGEGNLKAAYEELVYDKDLGDKIIFTGYMKDLRQMYNLADIFVLPSVDKSESFGLVLIEAMAAKLPVVASDLVGVRKLILKKNTGILVKPRDAALLAKSIDNLLDDDTLRKTMGENGYQMINEEYSWDIIVKKIAKTYQHLK